jgi:hypothetical protein
MARISRARTRTIMEHAWKLDVVDVVALADEAGSSARLIQWPPDFECRLVCHVVP